MLHSVCHIFLLSSFDPMIKISTILTLLTLNFVSRLSAEPAAVAASEIAANDKLLDAGEVGKVFQVKLLGDVLMKFSYCPHGSFAMGSPVGEDGQMSDEEQVQVRISKGFWMGQTEVTQEQWHVLMGTTIAQQAEKANDAGVLNGIGDDYPMYFVSWDDAQQFITRLNGVAGPASGWNFALPTEAQWEYACRAGTKTAFCFGDKLTSLQANIDPRNVFQPATLKEVVLAKACAVRRYPANNWGLYDMHGNVHEWCEDVRTDKLIGGTDPVGTGEWLYRVYRGGSWHGNAFTCRSACRYAEKAMFWRSLIGFRVAIVQRKRA